MIDEPKAMQEIHEIRQKLYEKTKGMTTQEFIAYMHQAAEEAAQKYGLKLRRLSKHRQAA